MGEQQENHPAVVSSDSGIRLTVATRRYTQRAGQAVNLSVHDVERKGVLDLTPIRSYSHIQYDFGKVTGSLTAAIRRHREPKSDSTDQLMWLWLWLWL
jgi:hypothetical protein